MSELTFGRYPVECIDITGEPLCRGVRECGTSVLDRCTCGFRRVAVAKHYGALPPAANQPRSSRRG